MTAEDRGRAGRILGVGLSRTGTKSLSRALETLGVRTIHYPGYAFEDGSIEIDPRALDEHEALLDTPIALSFPELDVRYPGSKFIYTVRETDAWLDSCRRFFFEGAFERPRVVELCRQLYGSEVFDEETFRAAYVRQDARVRSYFAARPDDLLVLDVCGGQGWDELCAFLERPMVNEPFPRC